MLRKFVDLNGNVLEETEWELTPHHLCFWCAEPLILVQNTDCPIGLDSRHDLVTLVSPRTDELGDRNEV